MRPCVAAALLLAALAARAPSQALEVASVKPSEAVVRKMDIRRDEGGGIVMTNVDLRTMVLMAYNIQAYQLSGGPTWLRSKRFDVDAKAPATAQKRQTWVMLQALLADRFQLAVHRETRELPLLELVAAKGGARIQPVQRDPGPADDSVQNSAGRIQSRLAGMDYLALTLSGMLERRVIDRTGLTGKYDYDLRFASDDNDTEHPSLYAALLEQLGLRLENSKGPVEILVIDRAGIPAAN
jgi:uncharacterized protein (TIGR03435 family)